MSDAPKTAQVYAPGTDELFSVPADQVKQYAAAGFKTGDEAPLAAKVESLKGPATALINFGNMVGFGIPKALMNMAPQLGMSQSDMQQLRDIEAERPKTKLAADIAGGIVPFALGAGAGGAAMEALGGSAAAGRLGGSGLTGAGIKAMDNIAEANPDDGPLTIERINAGVGLAGLLGVAGEAAPGAIKGLATKFQRGIASGLERISKSPAFVKTVIDPITESFAPDLVPHPSAAQSTMDSVPGLDADNPFDNVTPPGSATAPSSSPAMPPSLPETPTLSASEFDFAPTEKQLTDRKISEAMSRRGIKEATQREVDRIGMTGRDADAAVEQNWQNEIERAGNPYERDMFRSMRDEDLGRYIDKDIPATAPLTNEEFLAQYQRPDSSYDAGLERARAASEDIAARRAVAHAPPPETPYSKLPPLPNGILTDTTRPLPPFDFKAQKARLPTGRQLGKQLLREAPLPELPENFAEPGPDMLGGRLASEGRTEYALKPGAVSNHLFRSLNKATGGVVNPATLLFGGPHKAAFGAAAAAPELAAIASKYAGLGLLKQRVAVQSIVDFMAGPATDLASKTVKAIIQGKTGDISSSYVSGNVDQDYHAVANGVNDLAANPDKIHAYYQQRYGPMLADQPETLAAMVQHRTQQIQYLNNEMPRSSAPPSIIQEPFDPTRTQKLNYLAKFTAASDPFKAMTAPTSESIAALKVTNPQIYGQMIALAHAELANPAVVKTLSREQTRTLSLILGTNVRPYDDARYVAGLQQIAQAATSAAQQQGPAPPQAKQRANAKPINLGKQQGSFVSSVAPPSMQSQLDDVGAS